MSAAPKTKDDETSAPDPGDRADAGAGGDGEFDPEAYRMTLGEHLEELRRRVVLGLVGGLVALAVCLFYGERLTTFFSKALADGLREAGINPQMYVSDLAAPLMLYMKVSALVALAFAAPWILFQLWLFVAAGLYPKEQKVIKRYIPLSVILLVGGMALAYLVVMPLTVKFLLTFNSGFQLPGSGAGKPLVDVPLDQVVKVPVLNGDPRSPVIGQQWFNAIDGKYKMFIENHTVVLAYNSDSLLAQHITVDTYVDMTMMTLLVFGLAFQLPLVVMALHAVGILELETIRRSRRIVYFALAVAAAVIAPGDVVSAMLALYIPLVLLFEFGIFMCSWRERKLAARGLA